MKKLTVLLFSTLALFYSTVVFGGWVEYDRSNDNSINITLSTVTKRVRIIIDDPNNSRGTVRYSSNTIYDLINTAQRLFVINTGVLTTWATQDLTADTTEYLLPNNFLWMTRVTIDNNDGNGHIKLPQKTVFAMDRELASWTVDSSSQIPSSYYLQNRYIGVFPVPNNAGAELKIWYIKSPALMSAESDRIFDNYMSLESYWEALAAYAAYQILISENRLQLAGQYAQIWTQMLGLANAMIGTNPGNRPNSTGTTYPDAGRGYNR